MTEVNVVVTVRRPLIEGKGPACGPGVPANGYLDTAEFMPAGEDVG